MLWGLNRAERLPCFFPQFPGYSRFLQPLRSAPCGHGRGFKYCKSTNVFRFLIPKMPFWRQQPNLMIHSYLYRPEKLKLWYFNILSYIYFLNISLTCLQSFLNPSPMCIRYIFNISWILLIYVLNNSAEILLRCKWPSSIWFEYFFKCFDYFCISIELPLALQDLIYMLWKQLASLILRYFFYMH